MLHFSVTSKLDGIRSWSLEAGSTCPWSYGEDGELVPACEGCYAKTGTYRIQKVKAPRKANRQDWKRDEWVADMVNALDSDRYFRWFDSGDIYHPDLAMKILKVMMATPWVKHWLPTRAHKSPKIRPILEDMKKLPNVVVRYSSDEVDGSFVDGLHGSTILPTNEAVPGVVKCNASDHGGKCSGCRACWNKDVRVVGYVAHGHKMKKVIRIATEVSRHA